MTLRSVALRAKLLTVKAAERRAYQELTANQDLPADELNQLTDERAASIAQYAFDRSPFYRDLYTAAGFTRDDVADPRAFTSLPVVDRRAAKADAERIRVPGLRPQDVREALTGGSTGEPLRTWNDARVPLLPLSWRMYRWWGVHPSDDVVHIGRWAASRKDQLRTALTWWPTRVVLVNAGTLGPAVLADLVEQVNRHRPVLIEGYVGALYELARYVADNSLPFHPPRALGATAAPLTADVRSFVEQTLGAPLHDQYRCSEIPWMAGECHERNGLHVFADMRRIEVVDDSGAAVPPGVVGDLVVTDLANRAFPLVRYRLGDRGALRATPCPCGISLPLIDPPDGRTVDMIRLPDGTVVAGGLFSIFSSVPNAVRQFRLHQRADYSIELTVVPGDDHGAESDAERATESLRERLGHQVTVQLSFVTSLPYTGGKLKYVTSDVPS